MPKAHSDVLTPAQLWMATEPGRKSWPRLDFNSFHPRHLEFGSGLAFLLLA